MFRVANKSICLTLSFFFSIYPSSSLMSHSHSGIMLPPITTHASHRVCQAVLATIFFRDQPALPPSYSAFLRALEQVRLVCLLGEYLNFLFPISCSIFKVSIFDFFGIISF
jgi:hypothetical protein